MISETMPEQKAPEQKIEQSSSKGIGNLLISGGALSMLAVEILALPYHGGAIATAFFVIIIGLILRFPTLIQDGTTNSNDTNNASMMRIATLLIVSLFAILAIKTGWETPRLVDLKIDPTWIGVLGVALGGKVAQSFAENQKHN